VDSDGHIWVADSFTDRLQVFNREGQLLTYLGGHGTYPGQFGEIMGVAIDKQNRVFTTEQYPGGKMQMFRYVSDEEAAAEKTKREAELKAAADARRGVSSDTAQKPDDATTAKPDAAAPGQKPTDAPAQKTATTPPS